MMSWLGNIICAAAAFGGMVLAGAPSWGRWAVAVVVYAGFQAADFVVAKLGGGR